MSLSRRQLLVGSGVGLAAASIGGLALERQGIVDRLDPPHGPVPSGPVGPVLRGVLDSRARQRQVAWAVAYPPGTQPGDRLPVALVLHGRGGSSQDAFGPHALQYFLADAVRRGTPPFVLAAIDGGDHAYWHPRSSGEDPQAMLLQEYLPLLAARGLRTDRFGLTGWSMGGYGALLLAAQVPQRVCGVAVDAAALWLRAVDTAAGAFDDARDFDRHNVLAMTHRLGGVPLRLGCGRSDPFAEANRALTRALPQAEGTFPPGGHDLGCWNGLRPGDLHFLGRHLPSR